MALNSITGFASFKPLVKICTDIVKPLNIVEWGPGESTQFLLDNTQAQISSWENHPSYSKTAIERFKDKDRVTIHQSFSNSGNGKNTAYCNAPMLKFLYNSLEFIFVDGRQRADCMICAYHLISDTGIVILHDDQRPAYDEGRNLFPYSFRSAETITGVYSKDKNIIQKIEQLFDISQVPIGYGGQLDVGVPEDALKK